MSRRSLSATRSDGIYVAVVGGSVFETEACDQAERIGRLLAQRNAVIVCGGMTGVMEAVCRGAKAENGMTVGLLPGESRSEANDYVDIALPTGIGEMRNMLVVRASDGVIAVGGEFGTLSEVAFALRIGKPVVGLGTWELAKGGKADTTLERVASPEEAVDRVFELVRGDR
jgi:uncharacterized protein (TIGR00725 family)